MLRVKGKVAVVTGGAGGLGAAIAARLASEGARVIITDIDASAGQSLAHEIGGQFMPQDVTVEMDWDKIISHVVQNYGGLDILANNAGIEGPLESSNPENTRLSDWQAIHRVNLEGIFLGCRAAIPAMRQSGGGSIINLSSTAALRATPDFTAYGATKAAISHLTKSVALHCARSGSKIRCNSVHPGMVLTPMFRRIVGDLAKKREVPSETVLREFQFSIPQGDFQEPEDVANAVCFSPPKKLDTSLDLRWLWMAAVRCK